MKTSEVFKVRAACLAMTVHFQRVHELPRYVKTQWDVVAQRPVRLDEAPDE
jgi:hypothetical protein